MPAKSKSPEAAQRKVWKEELKTLGANRRKVEKDYLRADKAALAELSKAIKAEDRARKKLRTLRERHKTARPRALAKIESREAVLRGRLGL